MIKSSQQEHSATLHAYAKSWLSNPANKPIKGLRCTVNGKGDLFVLHEAREFIDEECTIIKRTKAGLIQVCLKDKPKRTYSVPQKNISYPIISQQTDNTLRITV